jgi:hypothetical protein
VDHQKSAGALTRPEHRAAWRGDRRHCWGEKTGEEGRWCERVRERDAAKEGSRREGSRSPHGRSSPRRPKRICRSKLGTAPAEPVLSKSHQTAKICGVTWTPLRGRVAPRFKYKKIKYRLSRWEASARRPAG